MKKPLVLLAAVGLIVCVARAQTSPPDDGETQSLQDIVVVTGRARALYRVEETGTGRLPADALTSSITISSINEELIHDQGARDVQDLYRNISGVSIFSYAGVTARGFRQEEIFFDGLRGDPYAGFAVPQLFNIERVDFLKGPAGMLYGAGAPGGLFNYITKKPVGEALGLVAGVLGTEERYGVSAEMNGSPGGGRMSGRAAIFYEKRNTPRMHTTSETVIYDGGLTFDFGFGDLILQVTRYQQALGGNRLRGVPVDDNGHFIADRRWNHNEPDDFLNLVSNNFQATIDGELAQDLTWNAGFRYSNSGENQEYHEPRRLVDTDGDGVVDFVDRREFRDQTRTENSISFGANMIWSRDFSVFGNRLMLGVDHFSQGRVFDYDRARYEAANVGGISLIDPVYGRSDRTTYILQSIDDGTRTDFTRQGAYLLNEATMGKLILTGGMRVDRFADTISDRIRGGNGSFSDQKATFRLGSVYRIRADISIFAQWAQSYEPQSLSDQTSGAGGPFGPVQGEIFEGGVRTELFDGRIQSSLAVYQIRRTNLLQNSGNDLDGDGEDDLVAFGEVTSRGFEIDLVADLTPNWVLTASYGYNDTKVTGDSGQGGTDRIRNRVGDRFANAPEHQFGFWTRYQIPGINMAIAVGGDYIGDRLSLSGQPVNQYMVFDASVIWDAGPLEVLLRVENLFDQTYAASGFVERTGHFPGDPRSVFIEVSRAW